MASVTREASSDKRAHFLVGEFGGRLAERAELADEALGQHGADGGGDEEGLDADVGETGDGGGRVVGVEGGEHQVTGERGVDGDVGGFRIADFPDHDDVRGLAEHGAQGGGEGHADVGLDHDLVDAGQLVFDRVLHGDDLAVRLVDDVEAGVERGGLAGTGGAGDQQDAVRQAEQLFEDRLVVREEAEFRQAEQQRGFVQNPHDDRLAVVGGHGGNPEVHLLVAHLELDPAVLRQAFFRDGHGAAHHLEAGDDRGQQFFRVGVHMDQLAVEAVADAHGGFERLDVNVGSADAERFGEHLQDEADDRRVVAYVAGFRVAGGHREAAGIGACRRLRRRDRTA